MTRTYSFAITVHPHPADGSAPKLSARVIEEALARQFPYARFDQFEATEIETPAVETAIDALLTLHEHPAEFDLNGATHQTIRDALNALGVLP